jgi:aarF domain-containing kinase
MGSDTSATNDATNVFKALQASGAGFRTWARLLLLLRKTRRWVDLLVDVHGYQIFVNGCFNGDPHPGNIMVLDDGRLGLIDYGQTRRLEDFDRLAMARVVVKLGDGSASKDVAIAMREAGFTTRRNSEEMLRKYALLFFDSDRDSVLDGFATPQLYFASLMATDPLVHVPDPASKSTIRMKIS